MTTAQIIVLVLQISIVVVSFSTGLKVTPAQGFSLFQRPGLLFRTTRCINSGMFSVCSV